MKQIRLMMGMPIIIEISDKNPSKSDINKIFAYFSEIDNQFSVYKSTSEVSRYNQGYLDFSQISPNLKYILAESQNTYNETNGYFNIHRPDGLIDPSGIVKGYAIFEASKRIDNMGYKNYYIDAGGDIAVKGLNSQNQPWKIGIRNPFDRTQNVKIVSIHNQGIATSGTSIRGQHIYDPFCPAKPITEIVSITVIGPDVYQADRFATAAFAMRKNGVNFISTLPGFEAYSIDSQGIATFTPGFKKYVV
jgi:FAD:protein FMN transferase